jgi:soluble lytic murein transglycosylase-like protein
MKISAVIAALTAILFLCAPSAFAAVPDYIVNAVIAVESNGEPWAESKDGCRGLGQIKRETWYWLCELNGKPWSFDEAFEPEKNKAMTRAYLEWLKDYLEKRDRFSWDLVFACYNAGPGNVRKHGWKVPPYKETRDYITKIKDLLAAADQH